MTNTAAKSTHRTLSYPRAHVRHFDRFIKRAFDIFASLLGLLILSPLFIYLAWRIKREDAGPIFYRGPRVGKDGKIFYILKFRTMVERPESYHGPRVTAKDDARITPLGKWLRETKLNELPQLWNVLKGDMSMVGPRPEDPEIAKNWPSDVRREILSVRPGITSPASIIYRDEEKMLRSSSLMDDYLKVILPEKLRLDQLYVRNHNFLSDIDIIFWTLLALLPNLRSTSIPTESLFWGFISRFTNRYFVWFLVDFVIAFIAVGAVGALWRLNEPLDLGLQRSIALAVLMATVFSFLNFWLGLGQISWTHASPMYVFDIAFSVTVSTVFLLVPKGLWPLYYILSVPMVLEIGLVAFLGFVVIRYRERLLTGLARHWLEIRKDRHTLGERVLIVGAGECGLLAIWLLEKSKLISVLSIIGIVDDDPSKTGMMVGGYRVLGLTRRIPEIVERERVNLILFAIEKIQPEEQDRILKMCHQTNARVVIIPDLMRILRDRLFVVAPNGTTSLIEDEQVHVGA